MKRLLNKLLTRPMLLGNKMNQNSPTPSMPIEVSVAAVKQMIDDHQSFLFVDCREPNEFARCRIDGTELIPMREIPQATERWTDRQQHIVIHCHHGGRSLRVADYLRAHGFPNVQSMAGGIDAWSLEVDPSVPRY